MAEGWPEAAPFDLLETALSQDAAAGAPSEAFHDRIAHLTRYAQDLGSRGILYTCSAFGPSIERAAAAAAAPVLKPNEAMFRDALSRGPRVAVIATFAPAISEMEAEFATMANGRGKLSTVLANGAMDLLRAGDPDGHDAAVALRAFGPPMRSS